MATLKMKNIFDVQHRTLKTFKIWKFKFRVPKNGMSGLPYFGRACRIILLAILLNALGSLSIETEVKCLGNTIRELFPSRHFVFRQTRTTTTASIPENDGRKWREKRRRDGVRISRTSSSSHVEGVVSGWNGQSASVDFCERILMAESRNLAHVSSECA